MKKKRFKFVRYFLSGHLKGIRYSDSIGFPNHKMFLDWIEKANEYNKKEFIILENRY
jgi:hypothetical protein